MKHISTSPMSAKARSLSARLCLRTRNDRGQSLVEFAVCLPVLLLILTGIFTFGIALNNYLMITNAVSIGARYLAISRGQTSDPCSTASGVIKNASPNLTSSGLTYSLLLTNTTSSGGTTSSSYSGTSCTSAATNLLEGASAQVTVTYPCNLKVYGANIAPGCTLTAQTTEIVQ